MSGGKATKRRSIGERITRSKSLATRRQYAIDWAANWQRDHDATLRQLELALGAGDIGIAGKYCGQLKALHGKAFSAIARVINALADEDVDE